jgi:ATP-dependent helicase Lhr and Lhr-like helicase
MLPADFHPLIERWWRERFGDAPPTAAQLDGWQAIRAGRHTLIAAPTGSGKTLAAFLTALDSLAREGLETGELRDEVRVIYVSPLKALSADIHKNLAEPRREIRRLAEEAGQPVRITAAVRSGDTPQKERAAMLRTPPHCRFPPSDRALVARTLWRRPNRSTCCSPPSARARCSRLRSS